MFGSVHPFELLFGYLLNVILGSCFGTEALVCVRFALLGWNKAIVVNLF
jgi:hypothetical protein